MPSECRLTPTFHIDNLKTVDVQSGKMVVDMLKKWSEISDALDEVEIEASEWFQGVTEDMITRTAFGRSYIDGKKVFKLQGEHMVYAAEDFRRVLIPGYRFLQIEKNISTWRLDKEIKKNLITLIGKRREVSKDVNIGDSSAKDLLSLMINASANKVGYDKWCTKLAQIVICSLFSS